MSKNLRRLEALEQSMSPDRMHCITRLDGQSQDEALAVYEAENGPVGPDNGGLLLVFISKPRAAA